MPAPQWYAIRITAPPQKVGYYGVLAPNPDAAEDRVRADLAEHFPNDGYTVDQEWTCLYENAPAEAQSVAYHIHDTIHVK